MGDVGNCELRPGPLSLKCPQLFFYEFAFDTFRYHKATSNILMENNSLGTKAEGEGLKGGDKPLINLLTFSNCHHCIIRMNFHTLLPGCV